jgi:hypothetical protein
MKKILFSTLLLISIISCVPKDNVLRENVTAIKPEKNDDGEWDLQVIDTQYDYFLNAITKPKDFYTESYLKSKNAILVTEWNSLYITRRYPNIIESSIDYDPQENYGLNFEYKLYQVFAYVKWKYGLKINGFTQ